MFVCLHTASSAPPAVKRTRVICSTAACELGYTYSDKWDSSVLLCVPQGVLERETEMENEEKRRGLERRIGVDRKGILAEMWMMEKRKGEIEREEKRRGLERGIKWI